jgi:dTDP-4-dehydrorhamnose 3,5-epimerase-like enzyme
MDSTLERVEVIDLPKVKDERGNLTFVENGDLPFEMKRVYWIYDVPGGQERGGHAFKRQQEVIVALSGSFSVKVNDGKQNATYNLNRSYYGLYIPNGLWRHMEDFSTNAVAFVIASTCYDEDDYVRDFNLFKEKEE